MSEVLQEIFNNLRPELLQAERERVEEEITRLNERQELIGNAITRRMIDVGISEAT